MFEKTKKTSPSGFCRNPTKTAEPMNTGLLFLEWRIFSPSRPLARLLVTATMEWFWWSSTCSSCAAGRLQRLQKELRGKGIDGGQEGEQDGGGGESRPCLHCSQSSHCQSTKSFTNLLFLLLNFCTLVISCLHFTSERWLAGWLACWLACTGTNLTWKWSLPSSQACCSLKE